MGVNELLKNKREEILQVAARHGAGNVRIFGSVARGAPTRKVRERAQTSLGRPFLGVPHLSTTNQYCVLRIPHDQSRQGLAA